MVRLDAWIGIGLMVRWILMEGSVVVLIGFFSVYFGLVSSLVRHYSVVISSCCCRYFVVREPSIRSHLVMVEKEPQAAFMLGAGTGSVLTAGMLPRFLKTKKMMPTGVVTLLGAAALGYNAMQLSRWWDLENYPFVKRS